MPVRSRIICLSLDIHVHRVISLSAPNFNVIIVEVNVGLAQF